jgi:galacturan 1,4-alpha-galacturonidase
MSNAQNGARIKAWAGSGVGSGIVKNVTFTNFIESKVDNPLVIDQVNDPPKVLSAVFFLKT